MIAHTQQTFKYIDISGVGQSWLMISWLWYKYPGFSDYSSIHYCNQPVLEISLDLNVAYSVLWIVDIISRSALVEFSMLRARNYYNRKGTVCFVLSFYNQYIYCELSILVLFILSRDIPDEVHFLLLYFDICHQRYFIMFYL